MSTALQRSAGLFTEVFITLSLHMTVSRCFNWSLYFVKKERKITFILERLYATLFTFCTVECYPLRFLYL